MSEPKTVLVIDDDQDYVTAIAALLVSSGYRVETASNGRDGLRQAKKLQPDLILLDVMMSERTEGFFLLQESRRIPAPPMRCCNDASRSWLAHMILASVARST